MKKGLIHLLAGMLLLIPCVCVAQTTSPQATDADILAFVGTWTGLENDCSSGVADCETSNVQVTVSYENGQGKVVFVLTPGASSGNRRHTASFGSKGTTTRTYAAKFEKKKGVTTLTYATKSGTRVEFTVTGGKLVGHNTSGRFNLSYSLSKSGS